jgi:hypothetical protein
MQQEPVLAVWRPAAAVSMRGWQRQYTADSWWYTLAKQAIGWCPGSGTVAWVASKRMRMALDLKHPKASKDITWNAWSAK